MHGQQNLASPGYDPVSKLAVGAGNSLRPMTPPGVGVGPSSDGQPLLPAIAQGTRLSIERVWSATDRLRDRANQLFGPIPSTGGPEKISDPTTLGDVLRRGDADLARAVSALEMEIDRLLNQLL